MRAFTYTRATTVDEALNSYRLNSESRFIGGGTNLLDLMKMGVERPAHLIDISRVPLNTIEEREGGLRIGAMVTNSQAANHPLVRSRFPLLSQAILAGASQQLRNMATMGGNLLQRTRCYYFYDPSYQECNKRVAGSGCSAIKGVNRIHAILGASDQCIATNPSDMCVALAALNATVQIQSATGPRSIPFVQFHRLPGTTPQIDTNLRPGEIITAVDLAKPSEGARAHYLKVRDRNSYAFALISVAAVVVLAPDGVVQQVQIALGGVAHKPWRASEAERFLAGQKLDAARAEAAAQKELKAAKPLSGNAFKVELAKRAIVRALMTMAA
jgi:xanthine dehydrogenase YagS FAD-binding subunit